mmetsp:Transcript_13424/g.6586  ORF Transcript_13424/g.6586 Transcript_13424/m.6586 type:complete len:90 (-) Transcript_13424:124-393(-)
MEKGYLSEMSSINLSLTTLGKVISALSKRKFYSHIPYRDSKLTRLLSDSLGGNCKTILISTISPTFECIDETYSTLKFSDRAKQVIFRV